MATNSYTPPRFLFNRHLETIFPSVFRKIKLQPASRERITTPDDDFIDIDWYRQGSSKCVIISHGLEGNSTRAYVTGMTRAFLSRGFDAAAWNFRGCSGEVNKQRRFYHSGATDDLSTVVDRAAKTYQDIYLIGFSLGGNLTLKYLGEPNVNTSVKRAVAISAPVDLHSCALEIQKSHNWIYNRRFINSLAQKIREKAALRNDLEPGKLTSIKTVMQFDDVYTGPIHGYKSALEYYTDCSSIHYLKNIRIPTLMLTAVNDPFLGRECYPEGINTEFITTNYPDHGGHVGFTLFGEKGLYWSEIKALEFILAER